METDQGQYVILGYCSSYLTGTPSLWLLGLSSAGDVAWGKAYSGKFVGSHVSNVRTSAGTLLGSSWYEGNQDAWIAEVRDDGEIAWAKKCGGVGSDEPLSMAVVSDRQCFLVGTSASDVSDYFDGWVFRFDSGAGDLGGCGYCVEMENPDEVSCPPSVEQAAFAVRPFAVEVTTASPAWPETTAVPRDHCGSERPSSFLGDVARD